jgi:fatty-acid desaturase
LTDTAATQDATNVSQVILVIVIIISVIIIIAILCCFCCTETCGSNGYPRYSDYAESDNFFAGVLVGESIANNHDHHYHDHDYGTCDNNHSDFSSSTGFGDTTSV